MTLRSLHHLDGQGRAALRYDTGRCAQLDRVGSASLYELLRWPLPLLGSTIPHNPRRARSVLLGGRFRAAFLHAACKVSDSGLRTRLQTSSVARAPFACPAREVVHVSNARPADGSNRRRELVHACSNQPEKTMSLFGSIIDKIFHHANAATGASSQPSAGTSTSAQQQPGGPAAGGQQTQAPAGAAGSQQSQAAGSASRSSAPLQGVDVNAVLTQLASRKGGGGNWKTSVVDLLKLLDLDSSMQARNQLAQELNVHAGAPGSAEQNIALQKAVMVKLAENGGQVPDSLRH
jgi:hypothetical protein